MRTLNLDKNKKAAIAVVGIVGAVSGIGYLLYNKFSGGSADIEYNTINDIMNRANNTIQFSDITEEEAIAGAAADVADEAANNAQNAENDADVSGAANDLEQADNDVNTAIIYGTADDIAAAEAARLAAQQALIASWSSALVLADTACREAGTAYDTAIGAYNTAQAKLAEMLAYNKSKIEHGLAMCQKWYQVEVDGTGRNFFTGYNSSQLPYWSYLSDAQKYNTTITPLLNAAGFGYPAGVITFNDPTFLSEIEQLKSIPYYSESMLADAQRAIDNCRISAVSAKTAAYATTERTLTITADIRLLNILNAEIGVVETYIANLRSRIAASTV